MTSTRARRLLLSVIAGFVITTAACGAGAIDESEVESSVATQLAEETGQPEPNIDCPGDLDAEVGATMECDLTVDGDDAVYPVEVKVTSVEDGTANYSVEVGEAPSSGGDEATEEEPAGDAPTEGETPAEGEPTEEDLPGEEVDPGAEGAE